MNGRSLLSVTSALASFSTRRRHGSKADYTSGWLGATPEGRRPQIRGFRAGGSLAVASSTPATQLLSPAKMLKLNHAQFRWHERSEGPGEKAASWPTGSLCRMSSVQLGPVHTVPGRRGSLAAGSSVSGVVCGLIFGVLTVVNAGALDLTGSGFRFDLTLRGSNSLGTTSSSVSTSRNVRSALTSGGSSTRSF